MTFDTELALLHNKLDSINSLIISTMTSDKSIFEKRALTKSLKEERTILRQKLFLLERFILGEIDRY